MSDSKEESETKGSEEKSLNNNGSPKIINAILQRYNELSENQKANVSDTFSNLIEENKLKRWGIRLKQLESDQQARKNLLKQIIVQRERLFVFLIILMAVETFVLFTIVIFASIPSPSIRLTVNDTTLQILVGATIAQISAMVIIIIRSVFPDSLNKIMGVDKSPSTEEDGV